MVEIQQNGGDAVFIPIQGTVLVLGIFILIFPSCTGNIQIISAHSSSCTLVVVLRTHLSVFVLLLPVSQMLLILQIVIFITPLPLVCLFL